MKLIDKRTDCKARVHTRWIAASAGILLTFIFGFIPRASAQITVRRPLHISHVQGVVTDRSGRPIANAEVALVREKSVALKTETDGSGRFAFDQASGRYWLRVTRSSYSPAARELIIEQGLKTPIPRTELFVVLWPGACMDDCSTIYTSKKNFDQAVRGFLNSE